MLEHQANPGLFLRKIYRDLKAGGVVAVTVPPAKSTIVGGHLTLWNAGLLLYNLIMAGFDCRNAAVKSYGYNISVIVRKRRACHPRDMVMDCGDIERLAHFFPCPAKQDFEGHIIELNWNLEAFDPRPVAGPVFDHLTLSIDKLRNQPTPFETDLDLLLWAMECRENDGHVLEFGVFQGRSINALAKFDPQVAIFGFDIFAGLPEAWVRSDVSTYQRGHFAVPALPTVPPNVTLVTGFFDQTLAPWRNRTLGPIALLHLDGDLYSSAIEPLCALNDRIVPGTMIVFDELCDWGDSGTYPRWQEHEWRALLVWMERYGRCIRPLGRGPSFNAAFVVAA